MQTRKLSFLLLILGCIGFLSAAKAQNIEVHFNASGTFFSYSGASESNKTSAVFNSSMDPNWRTEDPYSPGLTFSYMLEVEMMKIVKEDFIYGAGISFQQFNKETDFDSMMAIGVITQRFLAGGDVNLKNTYISLRPFAGKRIGIKDMLLDLTAAIDFALLLRSREDATVIGETGNSLDFYYNHKVPTVDIRPGIRAKLLIGNFGIHAGYSQGITKYKNLYNQNAKARVFYVGLGFRSK